MYQCALKFPLRIVYSTKQYALHEGVHEICESVKHALDAQLFYFSYIYGKPKSGKTHLSIYLANLLYEQGFYVKLIEGKRLKKLIDLYAPLRAKERVDDVKEAFIVDKAEDFFSTVPPGSSGKFVNFFESLKFASSKLIMLSSQEIHSFSFDEHIRSRLFSAFNYKLQDPSEEDLKTIIKLMAKQRGLLFTDKKINYIYSRIGKDLGLIDDYLDRVNDLTTLTNSKVDFLTLSAALEKKA
jgi:chromosomal replication initiation ATPase DnaA